MGMKSSIGAGKAAGKQAEAMKKIAQGYGTLTKKQYEAISPWMEAGQGALTAQMQMLANPINNQAALSTYYASPEYAMQQDAASYAAMAGAEATGTLGNTATANALAAEATSLGQNYLKSLNQGRQQQMNTLGDISNQGLGATKTMGGWASQNYNAAANMLTGASSAEGQETMVPYMGAQSMFNRGMWSLGMMARNGAFG